MIKKPRTDATLWGWWLTFNMVVLIGVCFFLTGGLSFAHIFWSYEIGNRDAIMIIGLAIQSTWMTFLALIWKIRSLEKQLADLKSGTSAPKPI